MLGPVILIIAAATGKISIPFTIAFLVVYIIFIIVVVITDRLGKKREEPEVRVNSTISTANQGKREEEKESLIPLEAESFKEVDSPKINITNGASNYSDEAENTVIYDRASLMGEDMKEGHFEHEEIELEYNSKITPELSTMNKRLHKTKHKMLWSLVKMNNFAFKTIQGESSWKEMNIFQKIIFILVDAPFGFLRKLTIPPSNDEQWDRRFAVIFPVCSVVYFFLVSGMIDFTSPPPLLFYILLGVGVVLGIIIYYTTKQQHAPRRFIIFYAFFAFLMSLVWIWFIANVLIDVLSLLGVVFSLKPAFLGVTVLAWGNSIGDMIANLAISKKGYAKMAMTGCIAGPLFNLFFGLGISLLKEAIKGNISDYTFHSPDSILPTV